MELPLTPLDLLARARRLFPDRVGVVEGDERWTYAEFAERCDRLGHALQRDLGVRPGRRRRLAVRQHATSCSRRTTACCSPAACCCRSTSGWRPPSCAPSSTTAARSSCSATPTSPIPGTPSGPSCSATSTRRSSPRSPPDPCATPAVDEHGAGRALLHVRLDGHPRRARCSATAASTSTPSTARSTMGLTGDDVLLHTIPLFHVNGWGTPALRHRARRACTCCSPASTPARCSASSRRTRVTRLFLVPAMARLVLDHPSPAGPRPVERAPDLGRAARRRPRPCSPSSRPPSGASASAATA